VTSRGKTPFHALRPKESATSDIASYKQWSSICPLLLAEPHHRLSQARSRTLNRIQSDGQALTMASARRSFTSSFEAGVGVRSQNTEDHDAGFCFLPCGLV